MCSLFIYTKCKINLNATSSEAWLMKNGHTAGILRKLESGLILLADQVTTAVLQLTFLHFWLIVGSGKWKSGFYLQN